METLGLSSRLEDILECGELQRRPIHGDPKISYIMIDEITGEGIALVDLDTVKRGLIQYDFGDCVRSVCKPARKEERNLNDAYIDKDLFEAL